MKNKLNYHLLPTSEASILTLGDNKNLYLSISAVESRNEEFKNQHLYLTDSSQIKENDWYIDEANTIRKAITGDFYYWSVRTNYKKIILTTDPKLDGVEKIDGNTKAYIMFPFSESSKLDVNFLAEFCKKYNQKDTKKVGIVRNGEPLYQPDTKKVDVADFVGAINYGFENSPKGEEVKVSARKCFELHNQALQSTGQYSLEDMVWALEKGYLQATIDSLESKKGKTMEDCKNKFIQSLQPSPKEEMVIEYNDGNLIFK